MDKSQQKKFIFHYACGMIIVGTIFLACYSFYMGYLNQSSRLTFDSVQGTVEEYNLFRKDVVHIKLEGHRERFRVSNNGNSFDMLGLQDRSLNVGEKVEFLYETPVRGGFYSVVGITTDTWSANTMDAYISYWDGFVLVCIIIGCVSVVAAIVTVIVLNRARRKQTVR